MYPGKLEPDSLLSAFYKQLDNSSGHMLDLPAQLGKLLKSFMAGAQNEFSFLRPECPGTPPQSLKKAVRFTGNAAKTTYLEQLWRKYSEISHAPADQGKSTNIVV